MSRFIFLLLLGLLIYLICSGLKRAGDRQRDGRPVRPSAEHMVVCARCGVHLPESEAIESVERYYCCEEHRRMKR